jgi:hypothetical protein
MVTYFKHYKTLSPLSPANNVFIRRIFKHSTSGVLAAGRITPRHKSKCIRH